MSSLTDAAAAEGIPEQVRRHLEQQISDGRMRPGEAIDERALAQRFGSSRTPVREALLVLQDRGLVEIVPRSGIRVRKLGAGALVAMMEALGELEGVLARLAALRMDPQERVHLGEALRGTQQMADAGDSVGYEQANAALHEVIYRGSRNAFIVDQTRLVRLRISPYRGRLFEKPGRLQASQAEHRRVVDAILAGDSEMAAQAMRDHLSAGGQVFADLVLRAEAGALD